MIIKYSFLSFSIFCSLTILASPISIKLPIEPINQGSLWIALDADSTFGSTVLRVDNERAVFLPFQADLLIEIEKSKVKTVKRYEDYKWSLENTSHCLVDFNKDNITLSIESLENVDYIRAVQWFRVDENSAIASGHNRVSRSNLGDIYLPSYYIVEPSGLLKIRGPYGALNTKPNIYQLLPRLFGNENQTRKINGTMNENGCGKFSDLSTKVLKRLKEDHYTHIWLTGVIQHATSTDYKKVGQDADDPDLLKGIAGSPYAIRDYFDVCPDFADDPSKRLEEFRSLAKRMRSCGLKLIIDFVPNHVARSYSSDIRPDLDFGNRDRRSQFFASDNNFFYLTSEVTDEHGPLRLPTVDHSTGHIVSSTARVVGRADGYFNPERKHGRVTGNNVVSWQPKSGDWYETVKLNYGFNFMNREASPEYPTAVTPSKRIPNTWKKMDAVVAYWQEMGVDGFRVDMAHLVPPEFWKWLVHRARTRQPEVFFMAEAYEDDPAKVPSHEPTLQNKGVMVSLLDAGFNSVYDDATYDVLMDLYEGRAWANDIDSLNQNINPMFFDRAVRYAENHDEVRLANASSWGSQGMGVGRPVAASLYGLSRGPIMVYHGQKVGEPATGAEGFGGDDQRTSIFDYWSMPEFNKWWNGGLVDGANLSTEQRTLRSWYVRLLEVLKEPAFTTGNTTFLNNLNIENPFYGKVEDRGPSGKWMYSYLRSDTNSDSHFLVLCNFSPDTDLRHVRVRLPDSALRGMGVYKQSSAWIVVEPSINNSNHRSIAYKASEVSREGLYFKKIESLSGEYYRIRVVYELPEDVIIGSSLPHGNAFLGSFPVLHMDSGQSISIDLRRYGNPADSHYYAVKAPDGIEARIDKLNHKLHLQTNDGAVGIYRINISLIPINNKKSLLESTITVAATKQEKYSFSLSGYEHAKSVNVVGDFNGWNSSIDKMLRANDGWSLSKAIKSNTFEYKYVIDGHWITDPANDKRLPDGHGGYNSLAEVKSELDADKPFNLFVDNIDNDYVTLFASDEIKSVYADVFPKNGGSRNLPVKVIGNRVRVNLEQYQSTGYLVRVIASSFDDAVCKPAIMYAGKPKEDIWRDDIIYYAFTDRFRDGNTANSYKVENDKVANIANYLGGDFEGIFAALNDGYFDSLGVNVIWLAPLNQNPAEAWKEYLPPFRFYTGYHGYWPIARYAVEPRFGGPDILQELIDSAHRNDMKILADLVLKHVHIKNPTFKEKPMLFGELMLTDGTRNLRRWDENPYTTWFEPFLPAFDFRNPDSINFLLNDAFYWIDKYRLDGYRLDAVKHIRPDFWWRFRSRMRDSFPDKTHYFVGETFESREGISAFIGPNMLDGQFDFPLYDTLMEVFGLSTAGFEEMENALSQSEKFYGRITLMSPLFGNHDKPRFMAYADGDLPDPDQSDEEEVGWSKMLRVDNIESYEKLKMAMTFIMTIDGVPMLYYGDEIGMTGAGDPDNRRMMRFNDSLTNEEKAVKAHFSKVAKARRAHPALYMGSRRALTHSESNYAYIRAYDKDRALILFNRSSEETSFKLNLSPEICSGELTDIISGSKIKVRNGSTEVTLKPNKSALYITTGGQDFD
ncbi:MAG: alpha-amylase family glycosyl hydrolase [Verrucomicrobiota bacterium]|nr:alpha-amylase family glycosyl hydrolase [Verrucomicrobiota bacterium]